MCIEKGYLTAGALGSGPTQSGHREVGNRPITLQKASQPQADLKQGSDPLRPKAGL